MGATLDALDVRGSRKNGICQMICGGLCVLFNVAILVVMAMTGGDGDDRPPFGISYFIWEQQNGAGIWCGVVYIISGALIFFSAGRRVLAIVIPALVMNVISLIFSFPHMWSMSLSVMIFRPYFGTSGSAWPDGDETTEVKVEWVRPVYLSLFSVSTILAYAAFALTVWAIVLLAEAIYWKRYNDAVSVSETRTSEKVDYSQTKSTNHALATASIKVNSVLQGFFALMAGGLNIAVVAVYVWGVRSPYIYEEMDQTMATAIITAPFFLVLRYFGLTAGQTGSNRRIVTFLCLSVFCALAAVVEGFAPCWSMGTYDPYREREICDPGDDPTECHWVRQESYERFYVPLMVLNSVILVIALLHFLLSIWGIVIASKALHKDNTCLRCCGNCFCGSCDLGLGRLGATCGDGCVFALKKARVVCGDSCASGTGVNVPRYQPIQFVVSHGGLTAKADGQRALVILLPLNENMNVEMKAGSATVIVDNAVAPDKPMVEAQNMNAEMEAASATVTVDNAVVPDNP